MYEAEAAAAGEAGRHSIRVTPGNTTSKVKTGSGVEQQWAVLASHEIGQGCFNATNAGGLLLVFFWAMLRSHAPTKAPQTAKSKRKLVERNK